MELPTNDLTRDEFLDEDAVADPFFEVDCDPHSQTGSDWYSLALHASLKGKALHGFTFATTSETLGKANHDYALRHTCGWVRTNERTLSVEQVGYEWDELIRPSRLFTGVTTGSQLALMFDTESWEPSSATRARNTAFLAAGMVAHGTSVSDACSIAETISGEPVPEAAIVNTIIPVSHLKREVAGVSKASHAVFSRANAQRYIRWEDAQLHNGILPPNAAIDWAKVTTIARYIAEANMRYDPKFRLVAEGIGVPYSLVKGSWAYVADSDFNLSRLDFSKVPSPETALIDKGSLRRAYALQTENLHFQVMRTFNQLAKPDDVGALEGLLKIAEKMRKPRTHHRSTISVGSDVLAQSSSHSQNAAAAAHNVASSGTSHNAFVQAVGEFITPDRQLMASASQVVAVRRRVEEIMQHLGPFYTIFASKFTWIRAYEILDALLHSPQLALDRMNRLHRSVTATSTTIEVDVPLTGAVKRQLAYHIVSVLKKVLIRAPPIVALPKYITSFKQSMERSLQHTMLRAIANHFHEFKDKWADRYEDWSRVYALAGGHLSDSVKYGATAKAFRLITADSILLPQSGYVDGSHVKGCYLHEMATDYSRKRRLAKPLLPIAPISGAPELAKMFDQQYDPEVPFTEVEMFVRSKLDMFAGDLALDIIPEPPEDDTPEVELVAETSTAEADEAEAALLLLLDDGAEFVWATRDKVFESYEGFGDPEVVAAANGYSNFDEAYNALGELARWDVETKYTQRFLDLQAATVEPQEDESEGITIA